MEKGISGKRVFIKFSFNFDVEETRAMPIFETFHEGMRWEFLPWPLRVKSTISSYDQESSYEVCSTFDAGSAGLPDHSKPHTGGEEGRCWNC